MQKNKIMIINTQKLVKIPSGIRLLIRRCCNAVLAHEEFENPVEVSVSFVDNAEIRALNAQYRNKDTETDVLSFPLGENGVYDTDPESGASLLGDIVISVEKAVEQAHVFGHSIQREIAFLTVHSMFHLMGYTHEEGGLAEVQMREREETVLAKLGLKRGVSYVSEDGE